MGRAGRWAVAGLVALAAFTVATWVSGAFLFTRLLPSTDIRWPVAFGIGATVASFAGMWGQWWATKSGDADRDAGLSPAQVEEIRAELTGPVAQPVGTGAAATPLTLAELPPVAAGFTGRDDDLATLRDVLDPNENAKTVAVVTGGPGVGKTALAIKAGLEARARDWFLGPTLFIDLRGYNELKVEPEQALDGLLRVLGVPGGRIPPDLGARQALYSSEVAKMAKDGKSVLVIADNAGAESQVEPLLLGIKEYKVVVTSRRPLAKLDTRLVVLTPLDITAGVGVLDGVLRGAQPDDDRIAVDPLSARRLAEACAGLPLALQIVASRLKAHRSIRVARLADELSDEKERLGVLQGDDGLGSVTAAFQLSYGQLSKATQRVFRMLSVNPGPDVSTETVEVLTELPERKVTGALRELEREHLIEPAPGAQDRWRMHDLLRLYARRLSEGHADTDAPERARERLFQYYLAEARAADERLQDPAEAVPGKFKSLDDALAWFDAERPNLVATAEMAARTAPNEVACDLPLALGQYFYRRRRFDDWLATLAISRTAADKSTNHNNRGNARTQLGWALAEQRQYEEAISACQDAVRIFEETKNQLGKAGALTNLGHTLRDLGEQKPAITACQEAFEAYKDAHDRHGAGNALDQLGMALQASGQFQDAIIAHEDAIKIFRETETKDRHGEGIALSNVGLAYRKVQRFEDAITACENAVTIFRDVVDPYSEGIALGRLGLALQEVQQFEKAAEAHRQNLKLCKKNKDRRGQAEVLNNLGMALQGSGRFKEAADVHQEAAAIFRELGDRPALALTYSQLGPLAEKQHDPGQALEWTVRCVALFDDVPHPGSGTGPDLLALLTHQQGIAALEACWQRITDSPLPGTVRDYVRSYRPDPEDRPKEAGR